MLSDEQIDTIRKSLPAVCNHVDAIRATEDFIRAELEKQEPFDADDPRFREAFEASLKSGNWPMTRLGEGYRRRNADVR